MLLLDLPSELLSAIFAWLGAESFRDDIACLSISRRWYTFAIAELLKDIETPLENLYRLLHSYTLQADRTTNHNKALEPLKQWVWYLPDHHRDIPAILARCTNLQSLAFKTQCYRYKCYSRKDGAGKDDEWGSFNAEGDGIMSTTIRNIISFTSVTHTLTSLELDLGASECVAFRDNDSPVGSGELFLHLCPLLADLMSRRHMRRLLLCLQKICPLLMQYASVIPKIWLEEFVLNLTPLVGMHSLCCYTGGYEVYPEHFETLAKKMIPRMVHPKVVKVVSHSGPKKQFIDMAYHLRVFDVMTNKSRLVECSPEVDDREGPISLSRLKDY